MRAAVRVCVLRAKTMKKTLLCLLIILLAPMFARADPSLSPKDQVRAMNRGVNIVGYDPLWKDPAKARFKTRHMKVIHDGGFNAVRIVLQSFAHMDANDKLSEQWFATLNELV